MYATMHTVWRLRLFGWSLGTLIALCVLTFAPAWFRGSVRIVAAYDAGALALLAFYSTVVFRDDEKRTRARAALDDPGLNVVLGIIVASVAAGMAGAIAILGKGPHVETLSERNVAIVLAILAAVAGWFLIHTTYALRYAHLFYRDDLARERCDGLTFPATPEPDDYDFLYFSFVVGMTFQVSDVVVNDPGIRRNVLVHGLISFGYNTAILALGVNLISSLIQQH
ncbi:MAG TPA: DUF1345 domain-containing protein [Candidatus Acidoferrales bacterium]|nr:DUF1345 domain-containing protein [Candidatus Acidoferrales bacterium]